MIRIARAAGVAAVVLLMFPLSAMAGTRPPTSAPTSAPASVLANGTSYTPFGPTRIVDSRHKIGLNSNLTDGVAATFMVAGVSGIPAGVLAVSGNLTVTDQNHGGYVALTTDPTNAPTTSTLNIPMGEVRANGVLITLSATGYLSVTAVHMNCAVVFDVTGYFTKDNTQSSWYPLVPARLMDTRQGVGLVGKFVQSVPRTLQVSGFGGVPVGATAITGNLTTVNSTGSSYVSVTLNPTATPGTSTLNFPAGDIRANNVVAPLSDTGSISMTYMGSGTTDLVFDVTGYFIKDNNGALFVPMAPTRVMDSRVAQGGPGPITSGKPDTLALAGKNGIDSSVVAVAGNLTATDVTYGGWGYVVPKAAGTPPTSNLNVPKGDIRANGFVDVLAPDLSLGVGFQASLGSAQLVVDLTGYFVQASRPIGSAAFTAPASSTTTDAISSSGTVSWTTTGSVLSLAVTQYSAPISGTGCSSTWTVWSTTTEAGLSRGYTNYAPGYCYRYMISVNGDPSSTVVSGIARYPTAASKVPVLMYHRVSPTIDPGSQLPGLVVDPATFDAQMQALHDAGWSTITAADLANRMATHAFIQDKTFVITFDDGRDDGYVYAYPILKKYGFVATFYIITGRTGAAQNISWDQAADLAKNGMEIASHTTDHVDVTTVHGTALDTEIGASKTAIETNLASRGATVTVTTFCYPFGDVTTETENYLKAHGFIAAFTEVSGAVRPGIDLLQAPRVRVSRDEAPATLLTALALS
jgi:peptidoglycan/xylan/chitin deacetylase (PgdA/CDA1 family)